jgi:hypothetical protein
MSRTKIEHFCNAEESSRFLAERGAKIYVSLGHGFGRFKTKNPHKQSHFGSFSLEKELLLCLMRRGAALGRWGEFFEAEDSQAADDHAAAEQAESVAVG